MALAAVDSKGVVLLLVIHCFMYHPLFVGVPFWTLFWFALLNGLSSFAIVLTGKSELITLL